MALSSVDEDRSRLQAWQHLLRPKSVALVGASRSNRLVSVLERNAGLVGGDYRIHLVNPNRSTIDGKPVYRDLGAIPEPVECAVINIPQAGVVKVIEDGLAIGVRAFTLYTSGFAELSLEGAEAQAKVRKLCADAGAVLLGPNCMGMVNWTDHVALYSTLIPPTDLRGNIGFVSQSGTVTWAAMHSTRCLAFTTVVSSGNESVVTTEDWLAHFIRDDQTRVIGLYVEAFREPKRFLDLADAALKAGKPIIALKAGRSDVGERACASHTASLSSPARVYEGVFRDLGVLQVTSLDELFDTAELVAGLGTAPRGPRVAIIGTSGAQAILGADAATAAGLEVPELDSGTEATIRATLNHPEQFVTSNPVDLGVGYRSRVSRDEGVRQCVTALLDDPGTDMVVFLQDCSRTMSDESIEEYTEMMKGLVAIGQQPAKPIIVVNPLGLEPNASFSMLLHDVGIPVLRGTQSAFTAVASLVRYQLALERPRLPSCPPAQPRIARNAVSDWLREHGPHSGIIGETKAKELMAAYGVSVSRDVMVNTATDAVKAANLLGFPVVLKVHSQDIVHKSDVGGVQMDLRSDAEVRRAFDEVMAAARTVTTEARVDGVIVSHMTAPGVELIVGILRDPFFGRLVLLGLGGTLVEVLDTVRIGLAPSTPEMAMAAVKGFPGSALLQGVRGAPPADREAVVAVVLALSELAGDLGERLESLEVNPLIVGRRSDGCVAVDARLTLREGGR